MQFSFWPKLGSLAGLILLDPKPRPPPRHLRDWGRHASRVCALVKRCILATISCSMGMLRFGTSELNVRKEVGWVLYLVSPGSISCPSTLCPTHPSAIPCSPVQPLPALRGSHPFLPTRCSSRSCFVNDSFLFLTIILYDHDLWSWV